MIHYGAASVSDFCLSSNVFSCWLLQTLTIAQLRRLSSLIEDSIRRCNEERLQCEMERSEAMFEIGNLIHDSVIVSNDEVCIYPKLRLPVYAWLVA